MKFKSQEELTEWALEAQRLWLFLDYDGTLAEFAPTPEFLEQNLEVIRLLEQLALKDSLRLAILSGRSLGHIRHLLPIPGIYLTGTYGIELLTPTGETFYRVEYDTVRPVLEALKPQWEWIIQGRKGFFLEDKGWTLAIHARLAERNEAEEVLTQARQVLKHDSVLRYFRVLGGHRFLEIAPKAASKGDTVSYLINEYPLPQARLLCIGDDDKDEEAFQVVHANGGAAVKVFQPSQASNPTQADFFFESPAATRRWLKTLL
jgi:trehalose-phosphatase